MYVFHYIYLPLEVRWLPYSGFARVLHDPLLGLLAYYASAIGIAFGVAFLSYHLYEKHFLKLKKYFPERATVAAAESNGPEIEASPVAPG
jgi:peptidoglycan/LPS O-acetylase OafA/YrhL